MQKTTTKRATMAEAVAAIIRAYDRLGPDSVTPRNAGVLLEAYRRDPRRGDRVGLPAIFETLPLAAFAGIAAEDLPPELLPSGLPGAGFFR